MVSTRRYGRRPATTTNTTTNPTVNTVNVDDEFHHAQINAANDAALRANALSVNDEIQAERPKNTKRTYGPKQKEFQVC